MVNLEVPQREKAIRVLRSKGIVRAVELRNAGVVPSTLSRLEREGLLTRLDRGLYQLANAKIETHHTLAEAAAAVSDGIVCLTSALAYHELTDQLPRYVWLAVPYTKRTPQLSNVPLRIVRMGDHFLHRQVETHVIERVPVRVFGVAKTVADCFRISRLVGRDIAIEALRRALRERRATPSELAEEARAGRAWTAMRPYLEALTSSA